MKILVSILVGLAIFVLCATDADAARRKKRGFRNHHVTHVVKKVKHYRKGKVAATRSGNGRTGLATIRSRSGAIAHINAAHVTNFACIVSSLEGAGYRISFMGGYSYRNIAGTNRLSKHAFGNALDINQTARNRVVYRLPQGVNGMANRCGLTHGAVWRNPDQGHFEIPGGGSTRGRRSRGRRR